MIKSSCVAQDFLQKFNFRRKIESFFRRFAEFYPDLLHMYFKLPAKTSEEREMNEVMKKNAKI